MKSASRRILALVMVLLAGLLAVVVPAVPMRAVAQENDEVSGVQPALSERSALNGTTWDFGDCSFRQGDLARDQANTTCWISFTLDELLSGQPVDKKIGPYTLTLTPSMSDFKFTLESGTAKAYTTGARVNQYSAFGDNHEGQRVFVPYPGDSKTPSIVVEGAQYNHVNFDHISLTHNGQEQPFSVIISDAEKTAYNGSPGEMISIIAEDGTTVKYDRITPKYTRKSGLISWKVYDEACTGNRPQDTRFGPGIVLDPVEWDLVGAEGEKDFICRVPGSLYKPPSDPGTWYFETRNPSSIRVGLGTSGGTIFGGLKPGVRQAFAMGIKVGRITLPSANGLVSVDNQDYERARTGQVTEFLPEDFSVFSRSRNADTPIDVTPGTTAAFLRPQSATGAYTDSIGFRSAVRGAQKARAFDRYTPEWTCSLADANGTVNTRTFTANNVPRDLPVRLNNNVKEGYSEVLVTDPSGKVPSCSVDWKTNYLPSTISLNKTVSGDAANYAELQDASYTFNYQCSLGSAEKDQSFGRAYPEVKLSGSNQVTAGQAATRDDLPRGAACEFAESNLPEVPGTDHELSWAQGQRSSVSALPQTSITLGATNVLGATNTYTAHKGSLLLTKKLIGSPVENADLGFNPRYEFQVRCTGTPFDTAVTMRMTGITTPAGQVKIDGVPINRDCQVLPLTGLSPEQSERLEFKGREVSFEGQPVSQNADGSYNFALSDAARTAPQEMNIVTTYEYQLRDVTVNKELAGEAFNNAELQHATFDIAYKCTWGSNQTKDGTVQVSAGTPATIEQIPVGAQCRVWEKAPPAIANIEHYQTRILVSAESGTPQEFSNDEAQEKTVLIVNTARDARQNTVTVRNYYRPLFGTVTVAKKVVDGGIKNLPDSYTIGFRCGNRTVTRADNTTESVALEGSVTVPAGGTATLVHPTTDSELAKIVNPDGKMAVPYGNSCSFTEEYTPGEGIDWKTDAPEQKVVVDKPSTEATVTNTFRPLVDELLISQNVSGKTNLAEDVTYTLTCNGPSSLTETFTLSAVESSKTFEVPKGSSCELTETSEDSRERAGAHGVYPITRTSQVHSGGITRDFSGTFTFDVAVDAMSTTVNVNHAYDFQYTDIAATKSVNAGQYISAARLEEKKTRLYDVYLTCVYPDGSDTASHHTQVFHGKGTAFKRIPVGSECTVREDPTSTATGVDLKRTITVGEKSGENELSFLAEADQSITVTNTFSRRLASVQLDKIADLPSDTIRSDYQAAGRELNADLHDHAFSMVCKDRATSDSFDDMAVLGEFTGSIKGEGSFTFDDVPVGADCRITGDQFGSLSLELPARDGVNLDAEGNPQALQAYLAPSEVHWVVDNNDGDTTIDKELVGDTTTSGIFTVTDVENQVDLRNYYDYETAPARMTVNYHGDISDLNLLKAEENVRFAYTCRAIGSSLSDIGLPTTLTRGNFVEASPGTYTFTSDEVQVPAGSLCTVSLSVDKGLNEALTATVTKPVISKRISAPGTDAAHFEFDVTYERRKAPVWFSVGQSGHLVSLPQDASYEVGYRCHPKDTQEPLYEGTKVIPVNPAMDQFTVANRTWDRVPRGAGDRIEVPVGYDCTFTLGGQAMEPRTDVEVTGTGEFENRGPATQFDSWSASKPDASAQGITTSLVERGRDGITNDHKKRAYTITIPTNLSSDAPELAIAAENYTPLAWVDVTVNKTVLGSAGAGREFRFSEQCSIQPGEFQVAAGSSGMIKNVPVGSQCLVQELPAEGDVSTGAYLKVTQSGELLREVSTSGDAQLSFRPSAVNEASDHRTAGPAWSLTAQNVMLDLHLEKTIDGTPLSTVTGMFGTALLPSDAQTMTINYTLRNDGGEAISDIVLKDLSLAGFELADGTTIDEDGNIPQAACALTGSTLAAGREVTCSIVVTIPVAPEETFSYEGQASVEAATSSGRMISESSTAAAFGAFRPSGLLGSLLPETGVQTLVWVLGFGLALFGLGAWSILRNRKEDEAVTHDSK